MAPVGIHYRSNTYQNIGCKFNKGCIIFLICKNNRLKLPYPCIRRYQSYHRGLEFNFKGEGAMTSFFLIQGVYDKVVQDTFFPVRLLPAGGGRRTGLRWYDWEVFNWFIYFRDTLYM